MLATWPAVTHLGSRFLAESSSSSGEATPGDHLQTGWGLWLFGHQLGHGRAPWRDPYSFQPELAPRVNFQGLVLGLPYWPLFALFGAVVAWNLFTLLAYVGAGGAACAWLRALGLPRAAALAGGLAFALAPYRVAQSTGHLLGPISLFLPLALFFVERRRTLLAAAAITAIPLSGQVSLAVGAVPFFIAYAFVRGRGLRDALPGTVGAVVAGELVQHFVISGSTHEEGRSLSEVGRYSADWIGFLSRHGHGETFVFFGWLTPLLALVGLVVLVRVAPLGDRVAPRGRRRRSRRRRARDAPPDVQARAPRGPAAQGRPRARAAASDRLPRTRRAARVRRRRLAARTDRSRRDGGPARARRRRPACAPLPRGRRGRGQRCLCGTAGASAPGRLLELPVRLPDDQRGSAYLYYDMTARRQRPAGYSTTVPRIADTTARRLRKLNCGGWSTDVERLGIRVITQHGGYYDTGGCLLRAARTLRRHGFGLRASDGKIVAWIRSS